MKQSTPEPYDIVITGGMLIDGTKAPALAADIAIKGERIVRIAEPGSLNADGAMVIDASEKIVAPGFIDAHTHDDNAVLTGPDMLPKISQGVTTVIAGNCGISLAPLTGTDCPPPLNLIGEPAHYRFPTVAEYAKAVDEAAPTVNVALLIGHSTLRVGAMKDLGKKADDNELTAMRETLDRAMKDGAIGLSTGTYYKTSAAADEDEIVALAEVVSRYGGVYATHMRDEQAGIFQSLDDTFDTARRADVEVIVSHHKCAGPDVWGRSADTLAVIEDASKHQPVGLDVYPYNAGSTVLDPDFVDERFRIFVSWSEPYPDMVGRDLSDIAAEWGLSQKQAAKRLNPAGGVYFSMDEDDVRRIMAYPDSMIGSDGLPRDTNPHPRLWGTFPRVLGHYCREEKLFDLVTAVHKMTGITAGRFGLRERGVLREGNYADIVVFDPETVLDRATFEQPKQVSQGIDAVLVNGTLSWQAEKPTGERAGRFLRRD